MKVTEKVSRDLHALLEDKRLLDNASGEQMVGPRRYFSPNHLVPRRVV